MDSIVPPLISAVSTPEIHTREDFARMLASTSGEIDALVAREPKYPVWALLQRQLHAMQEWTANGADPNPAQRERVSIGLVAARELEPAADAVMDNLITRLHLLNYFWRRWPFTQAAAAVPPPVLPPPVRKEVAMGRDDAQRTPHQRRLTYPPLPMSILLLVSFLLFTVACCLPALEFRNSHKPNDIMFGLRALVVGWSGIFAEVFAWYANPCWFMSLVLGFFRRPVAAGMMGVIAIVLATTTFSVVGRELPGDEGNVTRTTVIRLLPGCYLWMASMAVLPLAAFLRSRN